MLFFVQQLRKRTRDDDVPGLCPAAVLQSLLQADDRLGRRRLDHESYLHLYLHLHAAERHGRRYVDVDGLRMLPPVRLRLVRLRRRYFQFEFQFRLRMQPLLRLSRYAAGRSTIRWGGPFSVLYKQNKSAIMDLRQYRHIAQHVQNRRQFHAACSSV